MPGKVVTLEPPAETLAVRLYLPLLSGMALTFRKFVSNVLSRKARPTIEYPEERRAYSDRFRGRHILKTREDGTLKCVACYMCATHCPADCIHIEAGEHPNLAYEKYPTVFEIDLLRCVMCGFCVDACPKDAIWMTKDYELSFFARKDAVYGIPELTEKPSDTAPDGPGYGYRPYYGESPKRKAGQFEPSGLAVLPMTLARNADINRMPPPPPPKPPAPAPPKPA
ncbi:MAG TPA: NADH-quinone oxidoreductase subunit I [Thermoanaerobaculia bacterium]|nr:NADH-quinone oxidoreductase subunit I [Thermoanaerobaculia bacterium]HQN07333.1 NADH-quinone oxidoreductase subunit I [Thermoanaerobaculia bacterium]HQP86887.1 NADH-quinone oxidoreductase subunit I [Thermoanaerobaculia bacterium]